MIRRQLDWKSKVVMGLKMRGEARVVIDSGRELGQLGCLGVKEKWNGLQRVRSTRCHV